MEKQYLKVYKKPGFILTIMILGTCSFIYAPFLFGGKSFIYGDVGADTINVYYPFYNILARKIQEHDFSFWTFNYGMGTDILTRQSDVFNVFTWISILFGVKNIAKVLVYTQILKILICGQLCYCYLKYFEFGIKANIAASYVCAFNGFLMVWGQHYFMGNAVIYLLLLLVFIEATLHNQKRKIFLPLIVGLTLLYSYYIGYMILLFAAWYILLRLFYIYRWETRKDFIKKFAEILFLFLLGIALAAVILIPSINITFQSSRLESDLTIFQKAKGFLFSKYPPSVIKSIFGRAVSSCFFGINNYSGYCNFYEDPQLFFSTFITGICLIYVIESVLEKKRKGQKLVIFIAFLLIVFLVFNPLGSAMFNALAYSFFRYTFVLVPVQAFCFVAVFDKIFEKRLVWFHVEVAVAMIFQLALLMYITKGSDAVDVLSILRNEMFLIAVFYGIILCFRKRYVNRYFYCIIAVLVLNICYEGKCVNQNRGLLDDISPGFTKNYGRDEMKNVLAYLESMDQQMYRIDKMYMDTIYLNEAMFYGYNGFSTYDSVVDSDVHAFVENLWPEVMQGPGYGYYYFGNDYSDDIRASLVGVKYILSQQEESDSEYEFVCRVGNVYIYRNPHINNIAKIYYNVVGREEFLQMDNLEKNEVLLQTMVVENSDVEKDDAGGSQESMVYLTQGSNSGVLEADVELTTDGWLYMSIPYGNGWTAKVDTEKVDIIKANIGFMAVSVPSGKHKIQFLYQTPYMKLGKTISLYALICYTGYLGWNKKRNRQREIEEGSIA